MNPICPKCEGNTIKNGFVQDRQRWKCKECGQGFYQKDDTTPSEEPKVIPTVKDPEEVQKIQDKIAQLLKLAECSGATEGEALAAIEKVHALCAKYNIELSDVQNQETVASVSMKYFDDNWCNQWVTDIWVAVAKLYFCKVYTQRNIPVKNRRGGGVSKGMRRYVFGAEHNIAVVEHMAPYVVSAIRKEGNKNYKEHHTRLSFWKGAASRIKERANEIIETSEKSHDTFVNQAGESQSYGLVLASVYEKAANDAEAYAISLFGKIRETKRRKDLVDIEAYFHGKEVANNIALNQQLTTAGSPTLIHT